MELVELRVQPLVTGNMCARHMRDTAAQRISCLRCSRSARETSVVARRWPAAPSPASGCPPAAAPAGLAAAPMRGVRCPGNTEPMFEYINENHCLDEYEFSHHDQDRRPSCHPTWMRNAQLCHVQGRKHACDVLLELRNCRLTSVAVSGASPARDSSTACHSMSVRLRAEPTAPTTWADDTALMTVICQVRATLASCLEMCKPHDSASRTLLCYGSQQCQGDQILDCLEIHS